MQAPNGAIKSLLFLNIVSSFLKQFPRTLNNLLLSLSDTMGNLG
jgi:hypothetical protein